MVLETWKESKLDKIWGAQKLVATSCCPLHSNSSSWRNCLLPPRAHGQPQVAPVKTDQSSTGSGGSGWLTAEALNCSSQQWEGTSAQMWLGKSDSSYSQFLDSCDISQFPWYDGVGRVENWRKGCVWCSRSLISVLSHHLPAVWPRPSNLIWLSKHTLSVMGELGHSQIMVSFVFREGIWTFSKGNGEPEDDLWQESDRVRCALEESTWFQHLQQIGQGQGQGKVQGAD